MMYDTCEPTYARPVTFSPPIILLLLVQTSNLVSPSPAPRTPDAVANHDRVYSLGPSGVSGLQLVQFVSHLLGGAR
jgi:hypothetical protein